MLPKVMLSFLSCFKEIPFFHRKIFTKHVLRVKQFTILQDGFYPQKANTP